MKDNFEISINKIKSLESLKKSIINLKNCDLKKNASNIVFVMEIQNQKLCL